jgi:curved DNA-binding protein CbpA
MEDSEDPYKVLGVSRDASASQIKTAYRKLALKHHPDRQSDDESRRMATQIFSKISNAYEILGDENRRQQFDLQQHQQHQSAFYHPHHFQFHDPFQVFAEVFGEEFGTAPRSRGGLRDPFFPDPFFSDPFGRPGSGFGGSMFGGSMFGSFFGGRDPFEDHFGGRGGDQGIFSQMDMMRQQQMEMMRQQQEQGHGGVGGSYFYSSSSSSTSNRNANGVHESVTTSTRVINGKRQTVTERIVIKPDGTKERHVESSGDDDFPQQITGEGGWNQLEQEKRPQLPPDTSQNKRKPKSRY